MAAVHPAKRALRMLRLVSSLAAVLMAGVAHGELRTWELYSDQLPRPENEGRPALLEDPALLKQFVAEHLENRMAEAHIPGAVFLAIRDGAVIFRKGYGYKDLENRIPVDPATTMFRVASVSKTILGTTVMRLVDRGVIALDDPIAAVAPSIFLADRERFDPPVTVRSSLTHSNGFRDLFLNSSAPTVDKFEAIVPTIRNYLADQGAPSGKYVYYCNVCISMAAAALQDATGQSYMDLVTQEVFEPLGMRYAMLDIPGNPARKELRKHLAGQYVYDSREDRYRLHGEFIRNLYPPSSVAASADEMAKYMLMHMNGGVAEGRPFLSPQAHAEMHRRQISNHPLIPGYMITFKEGRRNGVDYYGHSGDHRGNDSTMVFLPDYDFGFFLSYSGDNSTFYRYFINDFIDTVFPRQTESLTLNIAPPGSLERYSGSYTNFRYDEPTPMQLVWPMFGQFLVTATPGGLLRIDYPAFYFKGGSVTYAKVEDGLFRKIDGGRELGIGEFLIDYLRFHTDGSGRGLAIATNVQNHSFVLTRVPAWKSENAFKALMLSALGGMAIIAVAGILFRGRTLAPGLLKRLKLPEALSGLTGWSLWGSATAGLAFVLAFYITIFTTRPTVNLTYGFDDLGLEPYFALPLASLALFGIAVFSLLYRTVTRSVPIANFLWVALAMTPVGIWVVSGHASECSILFCLGETRIDSMSLPV